MSDKMYESHESISVGLKIQKFPLANTSKFFVISMNKFVGKISIFNKMIIFIVL